MARLAIRERLPGRVREARPDGPASRRRGHLHLRPAPPARPPPSRSRSTPATPGSGCSRSTTAGAASSWRPPPRPTVTRTAWSRSCRRNRPKPTPPATGSASTRVLGVLEVRDEEAIENLQPPPTRPSRSRQTRPRSRSPVSPTPAGPSRRGFTAPCPPSASWPPRRNSRPPPRPCPAAQYAALHALACATTVDEALAEVVRLVPGRAAAQQKSTPTTWFPAMERAPGQVTFVSGPEELQHILAHPFAAWRTFLHPSQREIAYLTELRRPGPGDRGPGTGKTGPCCTAPPSWPSVPGPNPRLGPPDDL